LPRRSCICVSRSDPNKRFAFMDEHEQEQESEEEALWNSSMRRRVTEYIVRQGIVHGQIGDAPAWSVFPCVSIWAIESGNSRGWVGWWVICGDCPTDYAACTGDRTPRAAVEEFSSRWRAASAAMLKGERLPEFSVGNAGNAGELAPLLTSRAELLAEWALDDSLWER
jgi:hypothetical protein